MRVVIMAGVLATLAACGGPKVDDPENIPKLGMWTKEVKMGSVVVNGLTLDADQLPEGMLASLGEFASPESNATCMEPGARNRDEILGHSQSRFAQECAFPDTVATNGQLSMKSRCETLSKEKESPSDILVESNASGDALTITSRISVPMKDEGGATNRVDVTQYIKYRRTGDCPQ